MESETYFLHVIYQQISPLEPVPEYDPIHPNNRDYITHYHYNYILDIKRASMHRREREPENIKYSRVSIDFDPLQKQVGFVVVIHGYRDVGVERFHDVVHITHIFLSQEEADKAKKELEEGDYDHHILKDKKKKETFEKVEIYAVLITEK